MLSYRRIRQHRSTVILAVIVILSLLSLATGTEANWLGRTARKAVSVAATPLMRAFSATASAADYVGGFFVAYGAARNEAEALRGALAATTPRLAQFDELRAENDRLREMLNYRDSEPRLALQPVRVKVIGWLEGTLVIDQGSFHGVREAMCALTPDGVVGIVTKVDPFQSLVYTLHHTQCRIGAMVQRNRALGVVHGSGSDLSHVCRMEYIDMKDEVFEDDIVVTSGSAVFPRGLPLGKVTRVRDEGALLKTAYIEPFAQPYQIDEVFLVRRVQPSPEELAAFTPPEPRADESGGHAMPDTRPLQERWAP